MTLRFGSLFAGVGGFDLGLERAGMVPAWQVEIDPQAQDVERYHWPDVERHADVTKVGRANLSPVDLVCGGFPCQDVSVAGRRAGLAGERSGLWWEFDRILGELAPEWVLLENVGGLLSSNGTEDLGAILWALGERGYRWAYRCLDSQHLGVPQRRLRVFVVGRLGGASPAEVLLEPESLPWSAEARGEAGQDVAASLTRGAESGGRGGYAGRRREDDSNLVARPLYSSHPRGSGYRNDSDTAENLIAKPLAAREGKGPNSDADSGNLIAHTLRASGCDGSEDGTGRGTPLVAFNWQSGGDCRINASADATDALSVGQVPAVGFAFNQRREGRLQGVAGSVHEPSGTQLEGAIAASGVRRLTPRECERLQGFPDGWTRYGRRVSGDVYEQKDAPRYRQLGNAVTVNAAEWIARRLVAIAALRSAA